MGGSMGGLGPMGGVMKEDFMKGGSPGGPMGGLVGGPMGGQGGPPGSGRLLGSPMAIGGASKPLFGGPMGGPMGGPGGVMGGPGGSLGGPMNPLMGGMEEPSGPLPPKLVDWAGVVVKYQPVLRCGILRLAGPAAAVYCFYTDSSALGHLALGARVVASARLVRAEAKVPYLAASVRGEGAETVPGMVEALVAPARPQDMERFGGMAEDLALELPHLQQGTKRGGTGGREEEPKRRKDGEEEPEAVKKQKLAE